MLDNNSDTVLLPISECSFQCSYTFLKCKTKWFYAFRGISFKNAIKYVSLIFWYASMRIIFEIFFFPNFLAPPQNFLKQTGKARP